MTTFSEFKKLYKEAVKKKVETFFAGDSEFVVGYAKYLIQYLESVEGMGEDTVLDFKAMVER